MGTTNILSSSYLQSILSGLETSGLTGNSSSDSVTGTSASSVGQPPDKGQLSPFAQVLNKLQQLQQSDPSTYQQVTQQIATNLQSAAQTAQTDGNGTAASQLGQLATDFKNASQSGQLPNIQDLTQAIGGHHHHHTDSSSNNSADSTNSSGTSSSSSSQSLSQLLSALQTNSSQSDTLNPIAIIFNTLSSAGITGSTSE
jgi:hypothetical protein